MQKNDRYGKLIGWYHELHQLTGAMALNRTPSAEVLTSWADRLDVIVKEMKHVCQSTATEGEAERVPGQDARKGRIRS